MFERPDIGRVIFPDHDEKAAAWAKQKVEASWSKFSAHYDAQARSIWLRQFTERMNSLHVVPSVAQRALAGNQQSVIQIVHEQLTGDAGAEGIRDKTYDFAKAFSELRHASPLFKKYAWMGDSLASFSVGQLAALTGAVLSAAARDPNMRATTSRAIIKMQELWCIQQVLESATQGAIKGVAPKIPVLITTKVDVDEALAVLRARGRDSVQLSKTRIKKHRASNTKTPLTLLTDTEALKAAGGSAQSITHEAGNGQVKLGAHAAAVAVHQAAGSAVQLSEQQFLRLYQRQSTLGTQAVNAVRRALSGNIAKDMRVVTMTLEGRLALGSVFVQALGLVNGLHALDKAKSTDQVRDAWYGIYDSTGGLLGGVLQTFAVVKDARLISSVGESGAAKSVGLGALRFAASIAGAAGGILNSAALWAKAKDADKEGNTQVADLYFLSASAFLGTAGTSLATATGIVGDTLVARGIGGAAARTIAARVGANGVIAAIGGTALTVSGVGLVLLGAGIAFQVGAIAMTPTPLQRWIGRSFFGKDPGIFFAGKRDDMFPKGDWLSESASLDEIIRNESTNKP